MIYQKLFMLWEFQRGASCAPFLNPLMNITCSCTVFCVIDMSL